MMFQTILLPLDVEHEDRYRRLLPVALGLARQYGSRLHCLVVVAPVATAWVSTFFPEDFERRAAETARARLEEIVAEENTDGVALSLHVAHGRIYEKILERAESLGADLVIVGATRPDDDGYLLGPNAARVTRHARASVLVVRSPYRSA